MPGDLNLKKSWHPGLVKNQAVVHAKEQEALEERRRIQERQKEIKQERERDELQKLQEMATGQKRVQKVEWMYQDPTAVSSKQAFNDRGVDANKTDDYLLGKRRIDTLVKQKGDLEAFDDSLKRFERKDTDTGAEEIVHKVKDDPMAVVRQKGRELGYGGGEGDKRGRSDDRSRSRSRESRRPRRKREDSRDRRNRRDRDREGDRRRRRRDGDRTRRREREERREGERSDERRERSDRSDRERREAREDRERKERRERSSRRDRSSRDRSRDRSRERSREDREDRDRRERSDRSDRERSDRSDRSARSTRTFRDDRVAGMGREEKRDEIARDDRSTRDGRSSRERSREARDRSRERSRDRSRERQRSKRQEREERIEREKEEESRSERSGGSRVSRDSRDSRESQRSRESPQSRDSHRSREKSPERYVEKRPYRERSVEKDVIPRSSDQPSGSRDMRAPRECLEQSVSDISSRGYGADTEQSPSHSPIVRSPRDRRDNYRPSHKDEDAKRQFQRKEKEKGVEALPRGLQQMRVKLLASKKVSSVAKEKAATDAKLSDRLAKLKAMQDDAKAMEEDREERLNVKSKHEEAERLREALLRQKSSQLGRSEFAREEERKDLKDE